MTSRYSELREQCRQFHRENPEVWRLFCRFTFELIEAGHQHYSAKGIFERIRWETAVQAGHNEFKCNNSYSAFYARAFMRKYPQHDGFFRTRNQSSKSEEPTRLPPLGPRDWECRP